MLSRTRLDDARVIVHDDPGGAPSEATMGELFHGEFPGWDAGHTAILATSLILHLRPELVLMDRAVDDKSPSHPAYDIVPPPGSFIAPSGTLWKATAGDGEKGSTHMGRDGSKSHRRSRSRPHDSTTASDW
ncbi:MAG TPA: creatininase family protein [Solirubrobacteraceae bacterium]